MYHLTNECLCTVSWLSQLRCTILIVRPTIVHHKLDDATGATCDRYWACAGLTLSYPTKICTYAMVQDRCRSKYRGWFDICSATCCGCPMIPLHKWPCSLRLLGQTDTGAELPGRKPPTYLTCCDQTSKREATGCDRVDTL